MAYNCGKFGAGPGGTDRQGSGVYLPTERALSGGGYGAGGTVSKVGAPGGRKPIDRTVELIDSMWENSK